MGRSSGFNIHLDVSRGTRPSPSQAEQQSIGAILRSGGYSCSETSRERGPILLQPNSCTCSVQTERNREVETSIRLSDWQLENVYSRCRRFFYPIVVWLTTIQISIIWLVNSHDPPPLDRFEICKSLIRFLLDKQTYFFINKGTIKIDCLSNSLYTLNVYLWYTQPQRHIYCRFEHITLDWGPFHLHYTLLVQNSEKFFKRDLGQTVEPISWIDFWTENHYAVCTKFNNFCFGCRYYARLYIKWTWSLCSKVHQIKTRFGHRQPGNYYWVRP